MRPVEFVGQTGHLGPPKDTERGACGNLPVRQQPDETWGHSFQSYWKPSAEELAVLNAGGHVRLTTYSLHPPVWIDAEKIEELP